MLPPDVRRGSNGVWSGAKSYYESIGMEEHGHVTVSIEAPVLKTRRQVLEEERKVLWDYLNAMDCKVLVTEPIIPCANNAHDGICEHALQIGNQEEVS